MGRVFILPKKQQASVEPIKPIKGSPESDYYCVIKTSSGAYQVVTKAGNVVQATFPLKAFCFEWIAENDSKEAA